MSQQHKYAETYRIDVGTDAMMRRMQAMVAYNTMRQDGEVSGANLLVKRKYSRKHVERNVDSLNPKKNKDMTYYEYGCSTDGLRVAGDTSASTTRIYLSVDAVVGDLAV